MTAQQNITDERFHPCPAGRHWGPRGAAGILPYTVARDGQTWVLLSHRSPHVQRGGTWSTFGGAIDVGETAWRAAVRETCEEIRGITPDPAGIAGQCVWPCPQGCGWTYTTFVVRVALHSGGSLPRARVAHGRAAWETAGLAWVPVSQVQGADRDLHPSFADAWPVLREAISGQVPWEGIPGSRGLPGSLPAPPAGKIPVPLVLVSPGLPADRRPGARSLRACTAGMRSRALTWRVTWSPTSSTSF